MECPRLGVYPQPGWHLFLPAHLRMTTPTTLTTLVARPYGIADDVSDARIMNAVREYMMGAEPKEIAQSLGLSGMDFYAVTRSANWRTLQNHFIEEFKATTGSRLVRLESMVIDKLENQIRNGVEHMTTDENGVVYKHVRSMTPKEYVSVGLMLDTMNKRIDRNTQTDRTGRNRFNAKNVLKELEQFARAKTIDGEASREAQTG